VLASGIGLIGLLWWHISGLTHASQRWKMRAFLVTWVLTYLAFFLWWLPSYQHPLLIVLPPILLLGILTVVDISLATPRLSEKRMRLVVSSALMLLAVTNMYVAVRPRLSPSDSYWEAKELSEAAPGNARFLVSYRVWNHLRYYFDRQESARLAKFPLVYFYQDKQLPATYHLDDNSLVFIDSGFVAPGYRLEGYSSQPVNGFVRPDRWLAYISWLFGFESDSGGRIARARDFRVVRLREGNPYLLLLQEKKSVDNVSDFMRELETTLTSSGNERVLATWRGDAMTTPGE